MHKHKLIFYFLLFMLISSSLMAQADAPLILWVRGDLYSVTDLASPPTPLTQNGTISGPTLSPDGQLIAYKAAAPVGLAVLDRVQTSGFIADFDLPGDIYVFNVFAQQTALVATQPENASLFVEGTLDNAIVRSTPSWSPDGAMLAWMEFNFGTETLRLAIYDFSTRTQRIAANALPIQIELGSAPNLRWGAGGIAIINESGVSIYNPDGILLSNLQLLPEDDEAAQEYSWVDANGQSLFGIFYSSGRWALFDPSTGTEQVVNGSPLMISNTPDALALRFGVVPDVGIFWETIEPTGSTAASGAFPALPSRVTLSPSGREVAFIGYPDYGGAAIWRNGEVIPVAGTGSDTLAVGMVLWGATLWRLETP